MSDLKLDVDQAAELKYAFRRGDWTNEEIKRLCEGDLLKEVRNVVRGAAEITVIKRLAHVATFDLPGHAQPFKPVSYFVTGKGLFVWEGFERLVLSAAGACVEATPAIKVAGFDLIRDSADEQIRNGLPTEHVFPDAGVFCVYLAGMIDCQAGGKEGYLLTNGRANIFYVNVGNRVVAVYVLWLADTRGWRVFACGLGGVTWVAGGRVFSAAAAT